MRAAWSAIGADVIGRRLFDLTNGWNGRPPWAMRLRGDPSAAGRLAYTDAPFTLVADGLRSAIAQAQAIAGDRDVSITLAASPVGPSRPD
jgi:hypothetical protein